MSDVTLTSAMHRPVHFSDLKQFARSAAHYRYRIANPPQMNRAMRVGWLVDRSLTGGSVPIAFDGDRKNAAWKVWAAHQMAVAGWRIDELPTKAEAVEADEIVRAVNLHDLAMNYLTGEPQVSLRWRMHGVDMRTRGIDVVGDGWITDLKVTNCAEPEQLKRHARRMLWHAQLAAYREAARQNGIATDRGVMLVAIESSAPYPSTVMRLSEEVLADGERCLTQWLEALKACEAADAWPGYVQSVVEMEGYGAEVELTGFAEEESDAVE